MLTKEFLQSIHPNTSPKYSPNLYQWLTMRRNNYDLPKLQFYRYKREDCIFNGHIYIGFFDEHYFIGGHLGRIRGFGRKEGRGCYFQGENYTLIPDMWERYLQVGVCAFDNHNWYTRDAERWNIEGDKRTCNWCGLHQTLHRWQEMAQREQWQDVPKEEG